MDLYLIIMTVFMGLLIFCGLVIPLVICPAINFRKSVPNKIKFESFIAFYEIRPKKWVLESDYVIYFERESMSWYYNAKEAHKFRFTFVDSIRYRLWHVGIKRQEKYQAKQNEKQKQYEEYQRTIDFIKKDLEEFTAIKPWEDIRL